MNDSSNAPRTMQEKIQFSLQDPIELEKLYRSDKSGFKRAFNQLLPGLGAYPIAACWHARLNTRTDEISWGTKREWFFLLMAILLAGLIARLPFMLHMNTDYFYPRNIGFILFPILAAYFAWKNALSLPRMLLLGALMLVSAIYINSLPDNPKSDTLILACVHLALFLWSLLGIAFIGGQSQTEGRLAYLRFNGDLLVMTTLMAIAGGILIGVSLGLFGLIGFTNVEKYMEYILPFAMPAAPILGTYLTQKNPQLVGRVSPVIAKIFSPIVLVILFFYLLAIVITGKNPYSDRDFLILFNGLLVGVMAIIFFSIAESTRQGKSRVENWILLLLSALTVIINAVALSAIIFRISTYGITPNRAAVLGSNLLILIHLLMVATQLYRAIAQKKDLEGVRKSIVQYLPVYVAWTLIVTFLFPIIFGFR